ncbi:MAG: hypothetical protein J0H37_06480 [Hyphomicrobium denitrificans]|nr:hypothetical protein [Hyphomicrobium denitrificans]
MLRAKRIDAIRKFASGGSNRHANTVGTLVAYVPLLADPGARRTFEIIYLVENMRL